VSMLDDLLEEVKAAAKNEALAEYENEVDRLRTVVDSMERQIATLNVDRERWSKYAGEMADK